MKKASMMFSVLMLAATASMHASANEIPACERAALEAVHSKHESAYGKGPGAYELLDIRLIGNDRENDLYVYLVPTSDGHSYRVEVTKNCRHAYEPVEVVK